MNRLDRFDSLIRYWTEEVWPALDWRLIKAQAIAESDMDPRAVSPAGARGLLQLMPRTDVEIDGDEDAFDIEGNLENGIRYLKYLHSRFSEIPAEAERLKFALGAYNCGTGYINKAIQLFYLEETGEPIPPGHRNARPGNWQKWEHASFALAYEACTVRGRHCDFRQVWDYVGRVWSLYDSLRSFP